MENLKSFNIDWNNIKEDSYQLLPEGTYAGNITRTEVKTSKNGSGQYVNLEVTLLGASGVKGRKVFDICMLSHKNPAAVNVGAKKLKSIADSIGLDITEVESFSEFIGKPLGVKLSIEENAEYGDKNRIKSFLEFSEDLLSSNSSSF